MMPSERYRYKYRLNYVDVFFVNGKHYHDEMINLPLKSKKMFQGDKRVQYMNALNSHYH